MGGCPRRLVAPARGAEPRQARPAWHSAAGSLHEQTVNLSKAVSVFQIEGHSYEGSEDEAPAPRGERRLKVIAVR